MLHDRPVLWSHCFPTVLFCQKMTTLFLFPYVYVVHQKILLGIVFRKPDTKQYTKYKKKSQTYKKPWPFHPSKERWLLHLVSVKKSLKLKCLDSPHCTACSLLTSWLRAIKLLCSSLANSRLFVTSWYFETASLKKQNKKNHKTPQK